jgi:SAM-dependent methyltransferase
VTDRYYRRDLALVHHLGYGFHADNTAPGILRALEPVLARDGLVLELGCGSGLLTRHLLDAGHRVIATDASPAMLELTRETAPDAEDVRELVLPDDPLPRADAIVSVGHTLSYLPDEASINRALDAIGGTLEPGGVLAIDLLDHRYGAVRVEQPDHTQVHDDWAIFTRYDVPDPARFVRDITVFVRGDDGPGRTVWSRDDEHHVNVLVDTARVPERLAAHGVEVTVTPSFGEEPETVGLVAIVGQRVPG